MESKSWCASHLGITLQMDACLLISAQAQLPPDMVGCTHLAVQTATGDQLYCRATHSPAGLVTFVSQLVELASRTACCSALMVVPARLPAGGMKHAASDVVTWLAEYMHASLCGAYAVRGERGSLAITSTCSPKDCSQALLCLLSMRCPWLHINASACLKSCLHSWAV